MKTKKSGIDRSSIIEGIRSRVSGSTTGGLFIRIQEKVKNVVRLLGNCVEIKAHMFEGADGRWHKVVCARKNLVGKNPKWDKNDNCMLCKYVEELIRKGKPKLAEKLKAKSSFAWNALYKNDPNDENGELIMKVLEHGWQVFEGIGDVAEDRDDFQDPENGIGIIIRKKVKGVGRKKNTSYTAVEGEEWPLSKAEKNLEMNDLDKIYRFPKDWSAIATALDIDMEEFVEEEEGEEEDSEKEIIKKKKSSKSDIDDEDLEDDDEEEEEKPKKKKPVDDEDEDDEEEDDEEEKPKKKKVSRDDEDDDDEEEEEEEEEDDEEDEDDDEEEDDDDE